MIDVKLASSLGEGCRPRLSEIFVDGFGNDLKAFSRNRETLARALEHMCVLETFYVGLSGGEIVGMAACEGCEARAVRSDRRELVRHLGFVRGTIASTVFRQYFEKPPESVEEGVATVGFVATSPDYRGRGVATAILEHLHASLPYDAFILEAADNNTRAIQLYEKLGYREFKRDRQRFPKLSGFDYLVHMVYQKGPR